MVCRSTAFPRYVKTCKRNRSRSSRLPRGMFGTKQAPPPPSFGTCGIVSDKELRKVHLLAYWIYIYIYTCVIFQAGSDPQGRRPTGYRHGTRSVAVPAKSVPHQSACFQRRATPSRQNTTCCQQRISVIMQCFYTNATESGGIYGRMALLVR